MRLICESYVTFCKTQAVGARPCASSLTELFAPKISCSSGSRRFPEHYPWIPPEALDYFKSRLVQAPRDVSHGLRIVQQHCTTRRDPAAEAFEALAFKLEMLWAMIDTIHNAYRESRRDSARLRARGSGGWPGWTTIRSASGPCCCTPRAPCC